MRRCAETSSTPSSARISIFNLHVLYRQTGRYTDAYYLFVSLYKQTDGKPDAEVSNSRIAASRLLPTLHKLRRMAIENYQSCYLLAYYNFETPPEPQPEMVVSDGGTT